MMVNMIMSIWILSGKNSLITIIIMLNKFTTPSGTVAEGEFAINDGLSIN